MDYLNKKCNDKKWERSATKFENAQRKYRSTLRSFSEYNSLMRNDNIPFDDKKKYRTKRQENRHSYIFKRVDRKPLYIPAFPQLSSSTYKPNYKAI